jgi:hypothetical protein
LERAIVKQADDKASEEELDEIEAESDEELKEPQSVHEGMGIEKEEKEEGESYPEIRKVLEHEDKPEKSDEEEEEED